MMEMLMTSMAAAQFAWWKAVGNVTVAHVVKISAFLFAAMADVQEPSSAMTGTELQATDVPQHVLQNHQRFAAMAYGQVYIPALHSFCDVEVILANVFVLTQP